MVEGSAGSCRERTWAFRGQVLASKAGTRGHPESESARAGKRFFACATVGQALDTPGPWAFVTNLLGGSPRQGGVQAASTGRCALQCACQADASRAGRNPMPRPPGAAALQPGLSMHRTRNKKRVHDRVLTRDKRTCIISLDGRGFHQLKTRRLSRARPCKAQRAAPVMRIDEMHLAGPYCFPWGRGDGWQVSSVQPGTVG